MLFLMGEERGKGEKGKGKRVLQKIPKCPVAQNEKTQGLGDDEYRKWLSERFKKVSDDCWEID